MLHRVIACAIILMAVSLVPVSAEPLQIVTTSWHGLSGLFVIPSARTIGRGNFAVGFSESKHSEFIRNGKFVDRQIRGVGTYGITDWLEIYYAGYNNMYVVPPDRAPSLSNRTFNSYGFKARLLEEDSHSWTPEVSVGIRDINNNTRDSFPLVGVNNGRKLFLVTSKRVLRDPKIGRFLDLHAGLTWDQQTMAGLTGMELTLAPNASLIVEAIWDSPYINFRNFPNNNEPGRFLFNPGLRMYPELVPGLVLDMGFIGDSEFEFSFAASYVAHL